MENRNAVFQGSHEQQTDIGLYLSFTRQLERSDCATEIIQYLCTHLELNSEFVLSAVQILPSPLQTLQF